jgi:ribonuclease P protein component
VKNYPHKYNFSRRKRLITKAEYKSVFDKSKKISQRHLLILFKPNQKSYARMGLIVGKSISSSAVTRNQIKRIIRESFRHYQTELKNVDAIVIARKQCDKLSKENLRKGIDQLWKKLQTYHQ